MADALEHRGPDASGEWIDADVGLALAHRRLSIIDLSREGYQPMTSDCGRYVLVFNGEVYNHREIRKNIDAGGHDVAWRGHSDTEVMLAAITCWGLDRALQSFNGMFAFALLDRQKQTLYLVRDRLGKKPIYYGWIGGSFLFGSELKALKAHPAWQGEINRDALTLLLRYNQIPAPHSIYKNVFKLSPGTVLSLPLDFSGNPGKSETRTYWSARDVAERGTMNPFPGDRRDATAELDKILKKAVLLRMESDVPLGAFLSGGIDSSSVVALMQAQSTQRIKTFSIGFHEARFNEATHAAAVADHLGTEHTELYVTSEDAMAVIPGLPTMYDEPFSDSSQIPTFLVSKMARQHVTVALSGDGGDECFGGYNRYFQGRRIWRSLGWLPRPMRASAAKLIRSIPPRRWQSIFEKIAPMLPRSSRLRNFGDQIHKLSDILAVESEVEMYGNLVSHWKAPDAVVLGAREPSTILNQHGEWADLPDFFLTMMFLDFVSYLPNDILTKVDRASMAVSLEARVPLLDHEVVEFAWTLPLSFKFGQGQGKKILRDVLNSYVPGDLMDRPKMGFGVPIGDWLRGPLRDWAESLLDKSRLGQEGFFDPKPIEKKWHEHLSGERNWQYHLWDILMFQAWLEAQ